MSTNMALNIKKAIKEHGLQVQDVAAKMNISVIGISKHINGNPSVAVLERIADAIGCRVVDLFDDAPIRDEDEQAYFCPHCGKRIDLVIRLGAHEE